MRNGTSYAPFDHKPRISYFSMRLNIPQQTNSYDCGVYTLEYAERFMLDPLSFLHNQSVVLYPYLDRIESVTIKLQKLYNE